MDPEEGDAERKLMRTCTVIGMGSSALSAFPNCNVLVSFLFLVSEVCIHGHCPHCFEAGCGEKGHHGGESMVEQRSSLHCRHKAKIQRRGGQDLNSPCKDMPT